jgi:excisionase family DNA binding protein
MKTTTELARSKAERTPTPIDPLLLTPWEAAGVLRISERYLLELKERGDIPCIKIGTLVRYSPVHLQAWIDRMKLEQEARADGQHQSDQG